MVKKLLISRETSTSTILNYQKEVIGMLLIEQIYEPNNIRSDYVKCPACKRGRLCDKPVREKAMAIAIQGDTSKSRSSRIILKCPRCSQKFVISFTKE